MTISHEKKQEFEALGTQGSTLIRTTALSVALALAQYSSPIVSVDHTRIEVRRTEGTISQPLSFQLDELDLFNQINRVYDDLLRNQVDLDSESKRALYANLWNLYT
jgi:hypothetical protein